MESNSRAPALEINGKEKNSPSEKVSFQLVLEILQESDDQIVADSLLYDDGPVSTNVSTGLYCTIGGDHRSKVCYDIDNPWSVLRSDQIGPLHKNL